MSYLRHIDVYNSIRAAGILDKDPIAFGEPWPKGFFEAIEGRLKAFQSEYEQMLRDERLLMLKEPPTFKTELGRSVR